MLVHFLNGTIGAICTLASQALLNLRPSLARYPLVFELWIGDHIILLPVILKIYLVCEVKFGLLRLMLGLERVDWSFLTRRICQLHLIILGPILNILLILIQTLTLRIWEVRFLKSPIELVGWVTGEFRQLSTVNTKNLSSKFASHILNHFLSSLFFENVFVH